MVNSSEAAGSKRLLLVTGGLAASSLIAFLVGAALLATGLAMPSASRSDSVTVSPSSTETAKPVEAPAPPKTGFFSKIGRMVSKVVPSGGGPDRAGYEHGRPVGLYFMTRYWMTTHSLEKAVWYFTSDGRVYENPEDGFSDEALAAQKGPHGTATVDGDKLTVKWSDGKETSSPLEKENGGFNWDMGLFAPVEGFTDDTRLLGRWEGGQSLTSSSGWAATSHTLELQQGGRFTSESVASIKSSSSSSTVSGGSQGTSAGTWRLDGYTLILTYGDGRVVRGITFPFNDEKAERFYFAGTMYKKEH